MPAIVDERTSPSSAPVLAYANGAFGGSWESAGAAVGFPALAARSYGTYEGWQPSAASSSLTVAFASAASVDYIGVVIIGAPGSSTVTAQYSTDGTNYTSVGAATNAQAGTILWLFDSVASVQRVRISSSGLNVAGCRLAVLMAGQRTEMQRNIYVGHTPINLGRDTLIASNRSENGQYLGRIIRRESIGASVSLSNLTPAFYRNTLDPALVAMKTQPAFWAWRPDNGAGEVAYAWMNGNPSVVNQRPNGMMQASFELASGDFTL